MTLSIFNLKTHSTIVYSGHTVGTLLGAAECGNPGRYTDIRVHGLLYSRLVHRELLELYLDESTKSPTHKCQRARKSSPFGTPNSQNSDPALKRALGCPRSLSLSIVGAFDSDFRGVSNWCLE